MRAWPASLALTLGFLAFVLGGCADQHKDGSGHTVRSGPAPTPLQIAKVYNPSLEQVDRLWARTELRITGVDDKGQAFDETAEGHLQFIRPRKLALTVNKVGETYFCLGSNESRYWWMDLRKPRDAIIGTHEKATARVAARFGVPVHPLDLIDLIGVLPLDVAGASTAWSADGRQVVLTAPSRWGSKEMRFSPDGVRLEGVRLMGARGELLCESVVTATERVEIKEDPSASGVVPTRVTVKIPPRRTEVAIRLFDPQNRGSAMKQTAFDPQKLLAAYNINQARVRMVDDQPEGGR